MSGSQTIDVLFPVFVFFSSHLRRPIRYSDAFTWSLLVCNFGAEAEAEAKAKAKAEAKAKAKAEAKAGAEPESAMIEASSGPLRMRGDCDERGQKCTQPDATMGNR